MDDAKKHFSSSFYDRHVNFRSLAAGKPNSSFYSYFNFMAPRGHGFHLRSDLLDTISTEEKRCPPGRSYRMRFHENRRCYGVKRMRKELRDTGKHLGKARISRLMKEHGLEAKGKKKFRVTTDSAHQHPIATNVLERNFTPESPDRNWAGDITYIHTQEGWMYLAVFLDLFSRKVVG